MDLLISRLLISLMLFNVCGSTENSGLFSLIRLDAAKLVSMVFAVKPLLFLTSVVFLSWGGACGV